jgi:hypothetical protein
MKKILVLAIALVVIGMTVVSAQTADQLKQLQQVGQDFMNSPIPGTEGWPPASAFARYGGAITKPNTGGRYDVSYEQDGETLTIYMFKKYEPNFQTALTTTERFTDAEARTVRQHLEKVFTGYWQDFGERTGYKLETRKQDTQKRNVGGRVFYIRLSLYWNGGNDITITLDPVEGINAQ